LAEPGFSAAAPSGISVSTGFPFRLHHVICDGGIARGTHVLKALSVGAKACSGGRLYLYALAAAVQAGVERALENLRAEIERDMKLMGCRSVDQLNRDNLRFR
jgi:L-lactate dehydrogenase (cytochrome)